MRYVIIDSGSFCSSEGIEKAGLKIKWIMRGSGITQRVIVSEKHGHEG